MKPSRPYSLAGDDEARDDEILRRHGSHADDADPPARERMALARTRLRDVDGDDEAQRRAFDRPHKRAGSRR